ncbi:3-hydroxyacyl-CoA dehydrogenase NAD-binding domain-containing protein [Pseudohongiella spirulinae]|uniref:enoyl-CoA hydratase n=1 Tax=Pseudohongiella spirulinae TaxID=1249552 RepID=A0A0S2KFX1_9GAMM|nr:3-hydroxyacyl-CoA dehydrogenase NAD-binding domain-containing protein [Pseudohongiella spirulinae]ALO47222.1 crotonase [Pseudohongiella spirulinae]
MSETSANTVPEAIDANASKFRHWRLSRDRDNIIYAYLDREGERVNSLSRAVLEEFEQLIVMAETSSPRGLVLLSGKSTGFVFGADVKEFEGFTDPAAVTAEIQRVHDMFNRLENLKCPTVTAIEGYCLGGGLEMALACDYRIAKDVPATRIGFPEVQLGIFPGFGGSVRSVRTVGGLKAMELMLTARQLKARQAKAIGLIDQLIGRHEELLWAARNAVLKGKRHRGPGLVGRLSNLWPIRPLLAEQMRKQTRRKARPEHYPAPYRLIDTWEQFGGNRKKMMTEEARAVGELMVSPAAIGLRRVFHLMERLKSQGKQADFKARHVHVIGAGVMGGDIAAWCVLRGLNVSLQDREMKYITPALKRAESLFRKKLRDPAKVKAALDRLRPDPEAEFVGMADVVIEAIFENREAKQELFKSLEPALKPGAILATNTSAIPLEELAAVLAKPQRLIGLHFFNPVPKMPLVEVVGGKDSDPAELSKGAAFCQQISRFPLPVKSSPGFLVNRILAPYMMTALQLHREGVPAEALDAAAEAFGMPMGPVELADTVGLDVCLMVTGVLGNEEEGLPESPEKAFIQKLVDAGKLGKKSGEGLYRWEKDKPQKNANNIAGHNLEELAHKLVQAYTRECQAALADGVVADADLLDAGMIFGTGFAPFRGGPLYYLEQHKQQETDNRV